MMDSGGAGALIADFLRFSRARWAAAITLVVAGALLEGVGIMMLVPIVGLILTSPGRNDVVPFAASLLEKFGLTTQATQVAAVLLVFSAVLVLRFGVILARDDLLERLKEDFVLDLRSRAFSYFARAPWAEVAGVKQSPVSHALMRDVDRVIGGIGLVVAAGVSSVVVFVQIAIALVLAPIVTLIAAALAIVQFRLLRPLRDRATTRGQALTEEDFAMFETVGTFLRGLKPARAHGLEEEYVSAFGRAAGRVAAENRAFLRDHLLSRLILQTASGGVAVIVLLLGLFVLRTPPENLIVTLVILARLYLPLQVIQSTIQGVRHSAAGYSATRQLAAAADVRHDRSLPQSRRAPSEALASAPEMSFDRVCWLGENETERPVLDAVCARIPAGQVTALAGDSGAGKSTLCDLAIGLIDPDSGDIFIDGTTLDRSHARRLRASVAYVGQEPFLLEDSLRHSLCWGCGTCSEAEIWAALETVGAADIARALEGGLDGSIRSEGMRFSGGERQRLRLARALLRRPRFLVLDEATNALDIDAEAKVLEAVFRARDGATVLMVSHRPATLRFADHAILLDDGRVVETGPLSELAAVPASRVGAMLALGSIGATKRPGERAAEKSDVTAISAVD